MGVTKGGWGMFLTEEDAAKLGYLYMQSGVWNGRQLISRDWVREAVSPQIQTGQDANPEYGYHLWMDCRPGSFCYNGMLGQNVHCYPDIDMVIITNAGNAEVFQAGAMTDILRRYFGPVYHPADEALPENLSEYRSLQRMREHDILPGLALPYILRRDQVKAVRQAADAYLDTLKRGLRENYPKMSEDEIDRYLNRCHR